MFQIKEHIAIIRFMEPVTTESVQILIDKANLVIDYYFLKHIRLEIDSPGGEVSALGMFQEYRETLKERGVILETHALCNVSSAAAIMLSLGDVGHRSAGKHAKILYHFARVNGSMQLTANKSRQLSKDLDETDQHLIEKLIEHNADAVYQQFQHNQCFPKKTISMRSKRFAKSSASEWEKFQKSVKNRYRALFALDEPMSAEHAQDFCLIDHIA